jgi:GTPase SAR1 family protein
MVWKLKRPILVGGVGLSFTLWMLESWHDKVMQFGEFSLLSLLAVGGGLWLIKQNRPKPTDEQLDEMAIDRAMVENTIASSAIAINKLVEEAGDCGEALEKAALLQEKIPYLQSELDRESIKLTVTGGKSVGKTTLIELLQQENLASVEFQETLPLFIQGNSDTDAIDNAVKSDFVLFLTNGDLTETEFQSLEQLKAQNQRLMLVYNKQDQCLPDERASVLFSLKQRINGNVVATAASPQEIKVRKHLEDNSVQEWMEKPAPDIQDLTQQLDKVLAQRQQLVWATTMRKAKLLKTETKDLLNGIRKLRALPVIEQYQWISAAAAFANPVPALDILATAAINAQMVLDLGGVYQHKFSLEQGKTVAGEMGSLMLKLGLVELSTKTISTVLKSNAITFVAGGVVQGVSAAYLTRIAGLALVEYFQQQEIAANTGSEFNLEKFGQSLQQVFAQNQQMVFLQSFVKQGVKRLLPESENKVVAIENAAV